MINSAIENTADILKNVKKSIRPRPKRDFSQPTNELMELAMHGQGDIPPAPFMTLMYILHLPPETVITAEEISAQQKMRAKRVGGKKYKSEKTIRLEFGLLCKAGYMIRQLNYDEHGGSLPTSYLINFEKLYGGGPENSAPGVSDDNPPEIEQENTQKMDAENSAPPIYKERALSITLNTRNNNNPSGPDSPAEKSDPPQAEKSNPHVVVSLSEKVRSDIPKTTPLKRLIHKSIKADGEQETLNRIWYANNNVKDPGKYLGFLGKSIHEKWVVPEVTDANAAFSVWDRAAEEDARHAARLGDAPAASKDEVAEMLREFRNRKK